MTSRIRALWLLVLVCLAGTGTGWAKEPWHLWNTFSASHKCSPAETISALFEADFRDRMSDDYVYFAYLTYAKTIGRGFGVLAEGYWEWAQSLAGNWTEVNAAVGGITYAFGSPKKVHVKLQDQFFYRYNVNAKMDYHRPRITFTKTQGLHSLVVSDEMRVDLSGDRPFNFFRNRLYVTVLRKVSPTTAVGLGVVRQSDRKADGWSSFNVLQTVVNFSF